MHKIPLNRLFLGLALSLPTLAQTDTSALQGRVTDPQGGAVAGTLIQLTNQATRSGTKGRGRREGAYIFTLIPPGRYDVEAARAGVQDLP